MQFILLKKIYIINNLLNVEDNRVIFHLQNNKSISWEGERERERELNISILKADKEDCK